MKVLIVMPGIAMLAALLATLRIRPVDKDNFFKAMSDFVNKSTMYVL